MKETVKEKMRKRLVKALGNESGVTLIELLAVVVILAIIAAVAVPAVMKNFGTSKANTDIQNEQIIVDAIQRAVTDEASKNNQSVTGLANALTATDVLDGTVDITADGDGQIILFGAFGNKSTEAINLTGEYLNQFPKSQAPAGTNSTGFSIGSNSYSISESSTANQWTITSKK